MTKKVRTAFEMRPVVVALDDLLPTRPLDPALKHSEKYKTLAASVHEVGIIEAPVVYPQKGGKYLLLDGHRRVQILREMGRTEVRCLVSTDDEAFTYDGKISRLAPIQANKMIVRALEEGVSDERLARALIDTSLVPRVRDRQATPAVSPATRAPVQEHAERLEHAHSLRARTGRLREKRVRETSERLHLARPPHDRHVESADDTREVGIGVAGVGDSNRRDELAQRRAIARVALRQGERGRRQRVVEHRAHKLRELDELARATERAPVMQLRLGIPEATFGDRRERAQMVEVHRASFVERGGVGVREQLADLAPPSLRGELVCVEEAHLRVLWKTRSEARDEALGLVERLPVGLLA
ncbi:MAG: ParB/RepB/Spo0J family partition protein [Polyangiales bacterium]